MNYDDLIRQVDETRVETLLACGHYVVVSIGTSGWDFPDEPHWCRTCQESIQWHVDLQMLAYANME